jgi:phosphoserine aminotransferase
VNPAHDLVMVYNGTTSGVCLPDLDWLDAGREGLVLCDATSAAYAMPMDFSKLDVVTWSWQKVLGSEGAHGMLALSPRAVARLESTTPRFPLPKLFRLTKGGKLIGDIFSGATINTPSMLALEDLHAALDWAESLGGLEALWQRSRANFDCIDAWVSRSGWIDWLALVPETRSPTSMCLQIVDPDFTRLPAEDQQPAINAMLTRLEQEAVAYDIGNYRSAPPGFRIWGGATIDSSDLQALTPWLDYVFAEFKLSLQEKQK